MVLGVRGSRGTWFIHACLAPLNHTHPAGSPNPPLVSARNQESRLCPAALQIRGMHTIIRDRNTHAADFVFYADRLLRLVSEAAFTFSTMLCRMPRHPLAAVSAPTGQSN